MLNSLTVTYLRTDEVRPYPGTARRHSRAKLRKISKLIDRFGQLPIIVDQNNMILDGHAVHALMRERGAEQIAVIARSGLSEAEVRALRLALSRVPRDAAWDNERLRTEFSELVSLSFDLELTGFEVVEIDSLLEVDSPQPKEREDPTLPTLPNTPATTLGDVWICGNHRVICGDALDGSALATLLEGQRPDMAFLDPLHNLPVEGFASGQGWTREGEFVQASGEFNSDELEAFLTSTAQVLERSLRDGAVAYICMEMRHLYELLSAARRCGLPMLDLCVRAKTNATMGSLYRSQHEMVLVFRKGGHPNNLQRGRRGRHRSAVWSYRGVLGTGRKDRLATHPTAKPVPLIAEAIRDGTRRNDTVLDLFLGSGSTLLAAENTGRRCFGVELDPAYVDVAVRRWEQATARDAIHAQTGALFADVTALRQQGRGDDHE